MHKELCEAVKFQINEIDRLFEEYDLFFQDMNYDNPDLLQITVMSNILHSFYNGVEKIFEMISKDIDNFVAVGNKSHQELLDNIYTNNIRRRAIIDEEIYILLNDYLGFRHVFRHSYSFQLKWDKMKPLANNLFNTWKKLKEQIEKFINSLTKENKNNDKR